MKKLVLLLIVAFVLSTTGLGFSQQDPTNGDQQQDLVGVWSGQSNWVISGGDAAGGGNVQFSQPIPLEIEVTRQEGNRFSGVLRSGIFQEEMPLAGVIRQTDVNGQDQDNDNGQDQDNDNGDDNNQNNQAGQQTVYMTWLGILQFIGTLQNDTMNVIQISTHPVPIGGQQQGQSTTAGLAGDSVLTRQTNGEPTQPGNGEPTQPGNGEPTQPGNGEPTQPGNGEPAQPGGAT